MIMEISRSLVCKNIENLNDLNSEISILLRPKFYITFSYNFQGVFIFIDNHTLKTFRIFLGSENFDTYKTLF